MGKKEKKLSDIKRGTYEFTEDGKLICRLPCGHYFIPNGKWNAVRTGDGVTLHPSILCKGTADDHCGWHGYLTAGKFEEV